MADNMDKNMDKEALKAAKEAEKAAKKAKEERIKASKPKKEGNIATRAGNAIARFFKDFRGVAKKVSWPDAKTVFKNAGIVLAVVIVVGAAVYGVDQILNLAFSGVSDLAVQAGEYFAEDVSEVVTDEHGHAVHEHESEDASADASADVSEEASEDVSEEASEEASEEVSEDASEESEETESAVA